MLFQEVERCGVASQGCDRSYAGLSFVGVQLCGQYRTLRSTPAPQLACCNTLVIDVLA